MRKKLLLADDSVTIQKVVGISFANEDIELITVDNGDDAVSRALAERPDVVLADVVMPGMNGYEVCEALKNDPATAGVPVLLLTGTFEAFDDDRAAECGAAGHIAKPFEAQTLVDRVRDLMTAPPAAVEVAAPAAAVPAPMVSVGDDGATIAIGKLDLAEGASQAPGSSADSFDFFNEALSTESAPATGVALDPEGDSFAFAAEPAGLSDIPAPPATPVPGAFSDGPLAGTMLMGDDDLANVDPLSTIDDGVVSSPVAPSEDTLARLVTAGTDSADIFDFANDMPDAEAQLANQDFGQETILDPRGSSGYDVSSSDLNGLTEIVPTGDGDDMLWGEPSEPSTPMPPVGPARATTSDDLPPYADLPPVVAAATSASEPVDAPGMATVLDESSLEEVGSAAPAWDESNSSDAGEMPLMAAVPVSDSDVDASPRISTSHDPAAIAGIALAAIEPQLRDALHDTLEKIAWESLGGVAEQVIAQTVERFEKAAWEVIPQMAETLIREEIRRMKGE